MSYLNDVTNLNDLRDQFEHFEYQLSKLSEFQDLCILSQLCQELVNTRTLFLFLRQQQRHHFQSWNSLRIDFEVTWMMINFLANLMTVHIEREKLVILLIQIRLSMSFTLQVIKEHHLSSLICIWIAYLSPILFNFVLLIWSKDMHFFGYGSLCPPY